MSGRQSPSGPINELNVSAAIAQTAVATITTADLAVTVPGAVVGMVAVANFAAAAVIPAGLGIVSARVTAADTVTVRFMNTTAGSLNVPAQTMLFGLLRQVP